MSTIAILLSTYNGQKYLRQQLDSLLHQKGVEVKIIVRDDGSNDNTPLILKEYAEKHSNITLLLESNIGVEASFSLLVKYAFKETLCDYYAFADQDDVWFDNKLSCSIKAIEGQSGPALFCCNQIVTDSELNHLFLMIPSDDYEELVNRMNSNYFVNRHGCTMVWNMRLQEVLGCMTRHLNIIPTHDVWTMLVARCSGEVTIGKAPLQLYRVHNKNTSGLERNRFKRLKKGINLYLLRNNNRDMYAKECLSLLSKYGKNDSGAEYVRKVARYKMNFINRIRLMFSKQIWEGKKPDSILFALSVLMGKY